jgi:hypothetical protein
MTEPAAHRPLIAPMLHDWVPSARRLVLVDIENFLGGSSCSAAAVSTAYVSIHEGIGNTTGDVWVTACGPALLAAAMGAFHTRVLLGRGIDGADQQLVDQLSPESVVGRYASVVLVSGDARAFAAPVRALAARGVPTDVYLGAGRIGTDLYRAARSVTSVLPERAVAA